MASEEVNIDRELIKAQASGKWEKRDYRTLRYVGYEAVEATIEASVSDGRFVWSWSVVTKDKALPFAGHAPTLDKAIEDAQWHIEQVASVEQQVDVFSSVHSSLQTTPTTSQPPKPPPPKPTPIRPIRRIWSNTHVKAFAPAVVAGGLLAVGNLTSGVSFVTFLSLLLYSFLGFLYYLPVTIYVYKKGRFSWPFLIVNLLFNWTIIGWLACLGHAVDDEVTTNKPPPVPKPQPRRLQTSANQKSDKRRLQT